MGVYQAWEEDGSLAIEYFGGRGIGIAKLAIFNRAVGVRRRPAHS